MSNQFSHEQGPFDFIDRLIDLFHHPISQKPQAKSEKELYKNRYFANTKKVENYFAEFRNRAFLTGEYRHKREFLAPYDKLQMTTWPNADSQYLIRQSDLSPHIPLERSSLLECEFLANPKM